MPNTGLPQVQPNATLGFKVGLQSTVNSIITAGTGAVHGSFYLTQDTHRLYIGNEDGSLDAVNEGIRFVDDINQLPNFSGYTKEQIKPYVGQFYYIANGNILAVCNGHSWVQINDVIKSNSLEDVQISIITDSSDTSKKAVQTAVYQKDPNNVVTSKEDAFRIVGGDGVAITYSDTTITVGADTLTVPTITVSADYSIGVVTESGTTKVKLTSVNGTNNDSSFGVVAGGDILGDINTTIDINNGNLRIASQDTKITGVDLDNETQGFSLSLTDNYGTDSGLSDTIDPIITYGGSGGSSSHFANGTATLSVYTKGEIDTLMTNLNAMHYIGTYSPTSGTAATSIGQYSSTYGTAVSKNGEPVSLRIGDAILAADSIANYNNKKVTIGSLLIARSIDDTEDANGYIPENKLIFDIVLGRQERDTTYIFTTDNNDNLILQDDQGNVAGTFTLTTGTNGSDVTSDMIKVTKTTTTRADNEKDLTVSVAHKDVSRSNTTGTAVTAMDPGIGTLSNWQQETEFDVISGVTTNASGHVTGVETKHVTVKDTLSYFASGAGATASGDNANAQNPPAKKVGSIKSTYTLSNAGTDTSTATTYMNLTSSSLNITADNTLASPITGAGSTLRPGLNIEMVWGSF